MNYSNFIVFLRSWPQRIEGENASQCQLQDKTMQAIFFGRILSLWISMPISAHRNKICWGVQKFPNFCLQTKRFEVRPSRKPSNRTTKIASSRRYVCCNEKKWGDYGPFAIWEPRTKVHFFILLTNNNYFFFRSKRLRVFKEFSN